MLNKIITAIALLVSLAVNTTNAQVTYVHEDFMGSVVAESNVLGQITKRSHYEPYGEQRSSAISNEAAYTGHVFDDDLDLSYMGARYYDSSIGRFYSDDPVGFLSSNPASFNRYAYANNNPFAYKDPNGELPVLLIPIIVAIAKEVLATAAESAIEDATGLNIPLSTKNILKAGVKNTIKRVASGKVPKPPTGRGAVPPSERDPKRLFSRKDTKKKLDEQNGNCAQCGDPKKLEEVAGHHVKRHADGGKTVPTNNAAVCKDCHTELHSGTNTHIKLRKRE